MDRVKGFVRDLGKALAFGLIAAAAGSILFFLGGLIYGGGSLAMGLEAAKDGTLLIAALGLFLVAGMLLAQGKQPEKFAGKDGWKEKFPYAGYKSVAAVICAAFLLAAALADLMLMKIG